MKIVTAAPGLRCPSEALSVVAVGLALTPGVDPNKPVLLVIGVGGLARLPNGIYK